MCTCEDLAQRQPLASQGTMSQKKPDFLTPCTSTESVLFCVMAALPKHSVQFSHSVVSNSLRPCRLQHARFPCPSPTHQACSNSCPLNQWCHPTIPSSLVPFSSCLQSSSASESFPMSQFFASGGQSIGVSASASVLPVNIQNWFPLGLTGPKDSQESSPTPQQTYTPPKMHNLQLSRRRTQTNPNEGHAAKELAWMPQKHPWYERHRQRDCLRLEEAQGTWSWPWIGS